ncbi:MAG TPA: hypothetical protein VFX16_34580, partial [Pseudonocardiaceae bacterium]|nr:hypothetical protein [Pseudonocardiaceae bacterium]
GTPRFGRQFLSAREQAFTVMFGLGLGEPAAVDALDASADDIERALGLDQGRLYRPAGQGPWLTGPAAEGPAMFAEVGSLPNLIETLQSADDAEIEAARPLAYVLLTGLTTFSQIADAFAGYRNAAGIAGLTVFADNLMVRILFPAFVIAFMRSADNAASLVAVCSALSGTILPLKDQLDQLAALSADELTARLSNLDQLPPSRQNSVRRMIESARVTPTDNGADEPDR